jgi:hypothetical protein
MYKCTGIFLRKSEREGKRESEPCPYQSNINQESPTKQQAQTPIPLIRTKRDGNTRECDK